MNLCIIQARMASTRFFGKVLAGIGGRSMLDHVVERARAIPTIDEVVVTLPVHGAEEEALAAHARALGVGVFRNQLALTDTSNDVLGAYLATGRLRRADVVVRVTADCPLLDPAVAGLVLARVATGRALFASNCQPVRTYPDGLDVEAFTLKFLEIADLSVDPWDREHVTPSMRRLAWLPECPWEEAAGSVQHSEDWSAVRWTVDTRADLDKVRLIARHLPDGAYGMLDTVQAAQAAGVWP